MDLTLCILLQTIQSTVVSSLFPSQVREQIYEENAAKKESPQEKQIKEFMNVDMTSSEKHASRPIAQEYENTTVLFADIAGAPINGACTCIVEPNRSNSSATFYRIHQMERLPYASGSL